MFNPFAPFQEKFIAAFRKVKKRYLVSQSFTRDTMNPEGKRSLLLTHYDQKGHAQIHLNAMAADKYAAIIDLEKEEHREKLVSMIKPGSLYNVYSTLIPDANDIKKITDKIFAEKLQKYINRNTNWRIRRDQTLIAKVETTFGELRVVIKYGSQTIRIKLEELEKI